MNKRSFLLAAGAFLLSAGVATAQNFADVLRYSENYPTATARALATGNAFGALGADFTSLYINPAGLGVYRNPEGTISLNFNQMHNSADYLGTSMRDNKYNFNFSNMGLIFADTKYKMGKPVTEGWVSVNFGLGFMRTNNFHSNIAVEGHNPYTSMLQSFLEEAEGIPPGDLGAFSAAKLAYDTYLINPDDSSEFSNDYFTVIEADTNFQAVYQGDYYTTSGAMNDILFSIGGNYSNKFFLGASLIVPTVGYTYRRKFTETNTSEQIRYYESMIFNQYIRTTGLGLSGNLGGIYKPTDNLRFGLSYRLPSFLSLKDVYSNSMSSQITGFGSLFSETPQGEYRYTMTTPGRLTLSGSYLFGKGGFISADYERVNYAMGRLNYDGANEQNKLIYNYYKPAHNIRIGGEYRVDNFGFRLGYNYFDSPYQKDLVPAKFNASAHAFSAGFGIRSEDYFMDFGYQNLTRRSIIIPYYLQSAYVDEASTTGTRHTLMLTIGSRF